MKRPGFELRGVVMGWTLFTTTFIWTPTMRMFLKPEVSRWSVFGVSGSGTEGAFWIFPLAVVLALLLFYVEGRGRLRPLAHALLLAWHLPLTAAFIYWSIRLGSEVTFQGNAWGWEVPLAVLSVPFAAFSALALLWVWREVRTGPSVDPTGWLALDWRPLAAAAALLPVAIVFFRLGEGYDGSVKMAIVVNVLQWILLAQGLGSRPGTSSGAVAGPAAAAPDGGRSAGGSRAPC